MPQPPTSHVPPQNIEAEESVLGAMLVAEPALTRVIDEVRLTAEDFYLEKHALIFSRARELYAESKPVDELSVTEALVQHNQIEEAGGKHYVSELAAKVPAAGNAKHYAEIVQQNSLLRRLLGAGQEIQGWVHGRDGEPRAAARPPTIGPVKDCRQAAPRAKPQRLPPILDQTPARWSRSGVAGAVWGRDGRRRRPHLDTGDRPVHAGNRPCPQPAF